jgi:hypothetical protein
VGDFGWPSGELRQLILLKDNVFKTLKSISASSTSYTSGTAYQWLGIKGNWFDLYSKQYGRWMMNTKTLLKCLMAVAVLALGIGLAQAGTISLDLTGTAADVQSFSGIGYDQWQLTLDPFTAVSVSQGDTVNVTVNLDGDLTIPAPDPLSNYEISNITLGLQASDGSITGNTATSNVVTYLYLDGTQVGPTGNYISRTTTADQIAAGTNFYSIPPITFNELTSSFTIDTLGSSGNLDSGYISYDIYYTPEPSLILLLGLGLSAGLTKETISRIIEGDQF